VRRTEDGDTVPATGAGAVAQGDATGGGVNRVPDSKRVGRGSGQVGDDHDHRRTPQGITVRPHGPVSRTRTVPRPPQRPTRAVLDTAFYDRNDFSECAALACRATTTVATQPGCRGPTENQ
jgi:hypothetical protein